MSEEAAFLAALKANPADDTTRLVYADWLDEHGEPAKAEYLRLVTHLPLDGDGIDLYSEDATLAKELGNAIASVWCEAAAGRFDVVLLGYVDKVRAIRRVREVFEVSLESAVGIVECAPNRLIVHTAFSSALTHLRRFTESTGMELVVRPCDYAGTPSAVLFQVLATCTPYEGDHDSTDWGLAPERDRRAVTAFARLVATALGIDQSLAHAQITTAAFIPEDRRSTKCFVIADNIPLLDAQRLVAQCQPFVNINRDFGVDCHITGRIGSDT